MPLKNKTTYYSEFSMGEKDFERFFWILWNWDIIGVNLRSEFNPVDLIRYHSILKQFYFNVRGVLVDDRTITKELDKGFEDIMPEIIKIKKKIDRGHTPKFNYKLLDRLEKMDIQLRILKQRLGYGTLMTKKVSDRKKIKSAMGL